MLNLRHLEHIDAVARAGSLAAAANSLGISPPALSKSIRNLETHLGTSLFDRSGRVLTLTRFGREFTAEARRMLSQADHLESRAIAVARGEAGEIRVGTGPMAHQVMLPRALTRLEHDYRIDITEATWPDLVEGLLDYTYDFVVADPDDLARHTESTIFTVRPVVSMPLPILVRTGHPLLDKGEVSMAELVSQRWVAPRIPQHYKERIIEVAERAGIDRTQALPRINRMPDIRIEDFHACLQIACETDCLTAALFPIARPFIEAGRIQPLQIPFAFTTQTAIFTHSERVVTEAAERLIGAVLQAADELALSGHAAMQ
ncbi:MAG: LysR family transcriptional regulator [Gammaproteobacteria bacterium]|nr:LysR family transcriptional regulator [Gammaproteobacteria bacterium]